MRKGKLICLLAISFMLLFTVMPAPACAIVEPVETGDNTNIAVPVAIMCAALAGIITLLIIRRRRDK